MVTIDNNVAIPAQKRQGRASKYPWDELTVGQSFLAVGPQLDSMQVLCAYHRTEIKRFIARNEGDSVRVWRVG